MPRPLALIFAVLVAFILPISAANAQVYPPELAGVTLVQPAVEVELVIESVDGCPYSVPDLAGFYYYGTLSATADGINLELDYLAAPSGRVIGLPPPAWMETRRFPFDPVAGSYLILDDSNPARPTFEAITYLGGNTATMRAGRLVAMSACCPWYDFDAGACLVTYLVRPAISIQPKPGPEVVLE